MFAHGSTVKIGGNHRVHQAAEGPDVRSFAVRSLFGNFRSDVAWRAYRLKSHSLCVNVHDLLCKAKVCQLRDTNVVSFIKKHIFKFNVTMNYVATV